MRYCNLPLTEKGSCKFYASLGQEAPSEALKTNLHWFSKEEQKHVTLLDISGNKAMIDSYELKKIPDLKISNYMVDTKYEKGMPMPDVFETGHEKRGKISQAVSGLGDKTDNADAKAVSNPCTRRVKHKRLESM